MCTHLLYHILSRYISSMKILMFQYKPLLGAPSLTFLLDSTDSHSVSYPIPTGTIHYIYSNMFSMKSSLMLNDKLSGSTNKTVHTYFIRGYLAEQ